MWDGTTRRRVGTAAAYGGRRTVQDVARVRVKIMIARLSEPDARAHQNRERPARALAVDIAQAFFDQPVHVRQPAHEAELRLGHHLEGTHADEHATGRTQADRPRLFEELAVLRCKPGREIGRHVDERATDVLVPVDAHEVADEGREAGAGEEPPLADLEAPILERGELDSERDRRGLVPTVPIWTPPSSASLLDHTKLNTASVRGVVR